MSPAESHQALETIKNVTFPSGGIVIGEAGCISGPFENVTLVPFAPTAVTVDR